jgi:hypothetical protein
MLNSAAVTAAPIHTSCHAIFTRGKILYISANMSVITAKLTRKFTSCRSHSISPKMPPHHDPRADSAALIASETSSTKPMLTTSPSESTRLRMSAHRPSDFLAAGAFQMRSRSLWSSAKTVVAPITSTARPISVAMMPSLAAARAFHQALDGVCAVVADEAPDLRVELAARGVLAEEESRRSR